MTRKFLIAGCAVLALSAAACSKNPDKATATATPDANPAATIPTPANEAAAPDFATKAAISDMFEIEASKVALDRSNNKEVKAFAQMMIDAHTQSTADLKAAIAASGQAITLPAALPQDKLDAIDDLKKADAKDFDKKFMDAQVDGHQAALDLMTRYAQDGTVQSIKDFATKTGPVVQTHYDKAKALRDALK
jgi:putative membrane protein